MQRLFYSLLVVFVVGLIGCSTPIVTSDPLVGWTFLKGREVGTFDNGIKQDGIDYILKLSPTEKQCAQISGLFKDGTGQHAIRYQIAANGTYWLYVLIYDKNNKRVKNVKYAIGHYDK